MRKLSLMVITGDTILETDKSVRDGEDNEV